MRGSMQQLFYKNNFMEETKCLCFVRTVVGIRHFSFWLCRGYAPDGRHFWGFPLFRPALWGFPLYRPLDGKRTLSNASTMVENQTFGAGVTKIYYDYIVIIIFIISSVFYSFPAFSGPLSSSKSYFRCLLC